MDSNKYDYIMTFTSHNRALYVFNRLKWKNIDAKLVTAPNKINISCTQAIKFKEADEDTVRLEVKLNNVYPTAVYKIITNGKTEQYELVE